MLSYLIPSLGIAVETQRIDNSLLIVHPHFSAYIYHACSGLDGISFFLTAFSILMILDWRCHSFKIILSTYLIGIGYMFLLNIIRIAVFFVFAVELSAAWGQDKATTEFVNLFHGNVGWILYVVGISVFFWAFFKFEHSKQKVL